MLSPLFCTFITQSDYQFAISTDMITPLVLSLIVQTVGMRKKTSKEVIHR